MLMISVTYWNGRRGLLDLSRVCALIEGDDIGKTRMGTRVYFSSGNADDYLIIEDSLDDIIKYFGRIGVLKS